jgi:hypothetical protein
VRSPAGVEIINPNAQLFERRQEPRQDCDDEGCLIVMPGEAAISCRLMDQSSGGARVMFDSTVSISGEIWLVRKGNANVCRASTAWAMPHRMGLKFNLILALSPNGPCPPKVPQSVYEQWLNINGHKPKADEAEAFYLD